MILELVHKEYVESREKGNGKLSGLVVSLLVKALAAIALIVLEIFIFKNLDDKIKLYSKYGTFDFLVLFLFAMIFVDVIFSVLRARKVFFKQTDSEIMLPLPINTGEVIFAKSLYIYLNSVITNLVIATPILMTFGAARMFIPYYYVFSVLYPFFISLFTLGITLILVVPFQYLYKLIQGHDIIQFILASIIVIGLCFVYKVVLDLFFVLLSDSQIGGSFDESFIENLHNATPFLVPVNSLLDPIVNQENIFAGIAIYLGFTLIFLTVGGYLSSMTYIYMSQNELQKKKKQKEVKPLKLRGIFPALLKKEFIILFRNSGYTFSYTALLIMQPFLTTVVLSSLGSIMYKNLTVYVTYLPELINAINIALILLFNSVINNSASLGITREGKAVQFIKYAPISAFKQIVAKLAIPTILSAVSFTITELVLISTGVVSVTAFFFSRFTGLLLIVALNVLSLYFDMKDRAVKRSKLKILSPLLSMVLPLVIALGVVGLSFPIRESALIYLILVGIVVVFTLPIVLLSKKMLIKAFHSMEVN